MEELIKIEVKDGQKLVSARELHEKLKVQKDFSDWIKNQLESIDAVEGIEFTSLKGKTSYNGGRPSVEYILTLETAKEICMVVGVSPRTNTETKALSKKIRRYFIECEKQLQQKALPTTYKEALLELVAQVEENEKLQLQNKEQQKEIEFKQSVISGFNQKTTLAEKRQRISQIVRHNHTNYQDRWKLLYSEFDKKHRMNISIRLENAKNRKEIKKTANKLDYICDKLQMTEELYKLTCKLFMSDYTELLGEWNSILN